MAEDIKAKLKQKVQTCYKEYQAKWQKLGSQELIASAGEIHTVQQLARELPDMISEDDMEYLLRFKNPLEVAAGVWCGSVGYSIFDEEFNHALWELRDRGDPESCFELEPEFYDGDAQSLSM